MQVDNDDATESKKAASKPKKGKVLYSVEEIRGKKIVRGKVEYLIKWEGYPDEQCTWEPAINLKAYGCNAIIEEYERKERLKRGDFLEDLAKKPKKQQKPTDRNSPSEAKPKPDTNLPKDKPDKKEEPKPVAQERSKKPEPGVRIAELVQRDKDEDYDPAEEMLLQQLNKKRAPPLFQARGGLEGNLKESEPFKKKVEQLPKTIGNKNENKISKTSEPAEDKRSSKSGVDGSESQKKFNESERHPLERLDDLPLHGHYSHGDKAKKIIHARFENVTGVPYAVCFVDWNLRSNGVKPLASPFTNLELKGKDPQTLIEFYERILYSDLTKTQELLKKLGLMSTDTEEAKTSAVVPPQDQKSSKAQKLSAEKDVATGSEKIQRSGSLSSKNDDKGSDSYSNKKNISAKKSAPLTEKPASNQSEALVQRLLRSGPKKIDAEDRHRKFDTKSGGSDYQEDLIDE